MAEAISPEMQKRLLDAAQKVAANAYAPFSKFHVGAAILTSDGKIYVGCNVENSSYGMTNCAERTAIFTAIAENKKLDIRAVAVVHEGGTPCAPCGACRQVIFEHGPRAVVIYKAKDGNIAQAKITELLPEGFRLAE